MGNKDVFYFGYGTNFHYFAIEIIKKCELNVEVNVYKIEEKYQSFNHCETKNGDKVNAFVDSDDKILSLNVWGKYYFPTFTNNENQWYHKTTDKGTDYMDMLHAIMKFSYALAIKEIKIY